MTNPQYIPANIMRMVTMEARTDNREALVHFLISEPGTVTLTPKQEELLNRAREADRLMQAKRYSRREMELLLSDKFNYSIDTARNDMYLAEYIWGNAIKRNKTYLLSSHIDQIDDFIRMARQSGNDKFIEALLDLKTKAIKELPDNNTSDTTPAAIIFNISMDTANLFDGKPITEEEAKKTAGDYLGKDITDIEHEEIL